MRQNDLEEEYQLQMKEKAEYLKQVNNFSADEEGIDVELGSNCDKLTGEEP